MEDYGGLFLSHGRDDAGLGVVRHTNPFQSPHGAQYCPINTMGITRGTTYSAGSTGGEGGRREGERRVGEEKVGEEREREKIG